jgi:hypothetical protein
MHVAMVQVRVAVAVGLSAVSLASVMAVVAQPASAQEESTYSTPPGVTSVSRPNPQLAQAVATGVRTQTLLSGRITRPEDVVVEGLEIAAYLEPARDLTARAPHGAAFELVRLASAESDAQGDFTLRVPLIQDFTGYQDVHDGSLSLLVMGATDHVSVYRRLQVRPPADGGSVWLMATADEVVSTTPVTAQQEGLEDCVARQIEDACIVRLSPPDRPLTSLHIPATRTGARTVDGRQYCPSSYYWARSDANNIVRDIDILRVRTGPAAEMTFSWTSAKRTETDAAANVGTNGALVAAGYTKVQAVESGSTFRLPRHGGIKAARVPYNFRPYHLYCIDSYSGASRYSGIYEWRAYTYRLGGYFADSETWPCPGDQNRVPLGPGVATRFAINTTSQVSVGVSFPGVNLRRSQMHSDEHQIRFEAFYDTGTARICGKDNEPRLAKQVREG